MPPPYAGVFWVAGANQSLDFMSTTQFDLQGLDHHHHAHAGHGAGADKVKVYGADWCPWTRKQKEELQGANIEFEFIDCAQDNGQELCVGISGFPTIEIKGEQSAGFKPADAIQSLL